MIEYGKLNCVTGGVGTYYDGCLVTPKEIKKYFLLSPNADIDLAAGSFNEAARALLIQKGLLVPINDLLTMTEGGAKANVMTFPNKIEKFVSDGLYKFMAEHEANVCLIKAMRKLSKRKWGLLLLDAEGKLFFDKRNGKMQGFDINSFIVENETINDGGSKIATFTVSFQLSKDGTDGYNTRRQFLVGDEYFEVNGVQDVTLTVTDPADLLRFTLTAGCDGTTPVLGIAGFVLIKNASGALLGSFTFVPDEGNTEGYITESTGVIDGSDYTVQLWDATGENSFPVVSFEGNFYQSNIVAFTAAT